MTSPRKRIAISDDPLRDLMKAIATDIGKEVAAYIEYMYPQAVSATSSTFLLSVRNSIHNQIVSALLDGPTEETEILARLEDRRVARRRQKAQWELLRDTDWEAFLAKRAAMEGNPP